MNGRCKLLGELTGLNFFLVFNISSDIRLNKSLLVSFESQLLEQLQNTITRRLLPKCKVNFCVSNIHYRSLSHLFYFVFGISTYRPCSFETFLEVITPMRDQVISIFIDHHDKPTVIINASLYNTRSSIDESFFSGGKLTTHCIELLDVTFDLLEPCERIEVSELSLTQSNFTKSVITRIINKRLPAESGSMADDKFFVCFSDYLFFVFNSSPQHFFWNEVVSILIMSLLLDVHYC